MWVLEEVCMQWMDAFMTGIYLRDEFWPDGGTNLLIAGISLFLS